jgi:hypothetical protein
LLAIRFRGVVCAHTQVGHKGKTSSLGSRAQFHSDNNIDFAADADFEVIMPSGGACSLAGMCCVMCCALSAVCAKTRSRLVRDRLCWCS